MIVQEQKSFREYLQILIRYKFPVLTTAISIFVLALLVAFKWPPVFKSTATILIERQEIPQDLVRSTITSFADQRIQVISQRVMTSENIKKILDKYNLYSDDRKNKTLESLFEKFREDVNMEMISADVVDPRSGQPSQATIAFTLAYNSESAKLAQQVANELVGLYLSENLKRRNLAAMEATNFLALEAEKLRNHIAEVEQELAKFKESNTNALPELQQINMQLMDRTEQEINELDRQEVSLKERKFYLEAELAQMEPNMPTYGADGQRIFDSKDRLKVLQSEFISLSSDYGPNHPDVIKIQKRIKALEKDVGGVDGSEIANQIIQKRSQLADMSERYAKGHPDIIRLKNNIENLERAQLNLSKNKPLETTIATKPDNSAFIQLKAQLQSVDAELNAARTSRVKLKSKLAELEKYIRSAPEAERQYNKLMRDYENSTLKFREVKAKQMEADMSQAMEKDSKGEHFSLIEPPLFPEKPIKPNRPAIVFIGFILAIGIAFGIALLKSNLDPSLYSSKKLENITGTLLLVEIPYIKNSEDIFNDNKNRRNIIFGVFSIIVLSILILHFFIIPFDVLIAKIIRNVT